MDKIELLSPAGDIECLKAAVQNGADAVYFGAEKFNARINGKNLDKYELKEAIEYAKLRNVKTHLTLNILIKNNEFREALKLVDLAYKLGVDAVIVQDLGLAKQIIDIFPDLEVHSSTQMTTYNIEGVNELENIGFKRAVLARELTLEEIRKICKETNIEIEVFIHGALCICYSGQCLMSSIIGARSGNRGKCAGTCRLPYQLIDNINKKKLESGYLLSSKDVCTLDIIPELLTSGVKSLKIEGRMKSSAYVGGITAIYRKYIDLAQSTKDYKVDEEDRKKLMQLFNRGGFSTGYLKGKLGSKMMYFKQPNHMGIYIGKVDDYNRNKEYIKIKLSENLDLGDSIAINGASCKISELMKNKMNIKNASRGDYVTIGRIRGNILKGQSVYKTVSLYLNKEINNKIQSENIKRLINCKLILKHGEKIQFEVQDIETKEKVYVIKEGKVELAKKEGTSKQRIIEQLEKTKNTIFKIKNIQLDMEEKIFIPISIINEIRREALDKLESKLKDDFHKESNMNKIKAITKTNNKECGEISILLNNIKEDINYEKIKGINNVYIPLNLFFRTDLKEKINEICDNFKVYVYLPAITKTNYERIIKNNLKIIMNMKINGFVISNISQIRMLKDVAESKELIANYTLNAINDYTLDELEKYNFTKYIVTPELDKDEIRNLNSNMSKEVIAYGRTLLMTSEYCPIGKNEHCNNECTKTKYVLRDRLGFDFPIYTDRINCNALIYNSKITSINYEDLNSNSLRIDILDENEDEIKNIIDKILKHQKLEGKDYTNGNLNKNI